MKRGISLFMTLIMAVTVFAVPSSAVATTGQTGATEAAVEQGQSTEPSGGIEDNVAEGTENSDPETQGQQEGVTADISAATVETVLQYRSFAFKKKAIEPEITVELGGTVLTKDVDYTVSYSDNIYPGEASITVTGIGKYTGTATKNFYIARVLDFEVKTTGINYQVLKWKKSSYVSGYKIYRYDEEDGEWKRIKTITSNKTTSTKLKKRDYATGYTYAIRTYYKKGLNTYNGTLSEPLHAPTKPYKSEIKYITESATLDMEVEWGKLRCTGYQVRIADNSSYKNATTYTIEDQKTTKYLITGLEDQEKYYVKVRAYKEHEGVRVYGKWSASSSRKASDSGIARIDGKTYYMSNGTILKGTRTISGNKYYLDEETGELRGASKTMWNKVKDADSRTQYLACVSRELNRTVVYEKVNGEWAVKFYWKCTTGAKRTPSPKGSFYTPKTKPKLVKFSGLPGTYTVWYATRIKGRTWFHSILYDYGQKKTIYDGRLGRNLSHGCIRLAIDNALWMNRNIEPGTKVIIY